MTTLRQYLAWGLIAYAAAEITFIFINWALRGPDATIFQRSSHVDTTTVTTIGLPILAVLISNAVQPVLKNGTTIALIAVIEYLVVLLFGGLAFLLGSVHMARVVDNLHSWLAMLSYVVFTLLGFALATLAAAVGWHYHRGAR